jgi:hypothetical protein
VKNKAVVASIVVLGVMLGSVGVALSQDKPAGKPPEAKTQDKKPDHGGAQEDMPPEMLKAMTPGDHHKHLDVLVGEFSLAGKAWMAPDAPPEEFTGTSKKAWSMDGRYIEDNTSGPGMMEGTQFVGRGIYGYDNVKQQYTMVWYDNHSTGMMISYGTCDGSGKVLTTTGDYGDPMTGEKAQKFKCVFRVESKDKHTWESYKIGKDGKEVKDMEIVYTRGSSAKPAVGTGK